MQKFTCNSAKVKEIIYLHRKSQHFFFFFLVFSREKISLRRLDIHVRIIGSLKYQLGTRKPNKSDMRVQSNANKLYRRNWNVNAFK